MSSYNLLDFQVSDSDDDDPVPPANVRRSSRVLARDSPWLNHPSEQILELLEKQGILVKSGTPREDLLSMALSILGTPSISDQEDIASPEAPAQPKKASRKRPAKPPPSQPGKRVYKAPTRSQPSASQIQTSPVSDQSIVEAILSLTSTVKGLEARMEAFERPSTSTPAASLNISAFSHAPLPSTSSFLPAAFRPPAHSAGAPLTKASALAGLHTFNLASALPAQDPGVQAAMPNSQPGADTMPSVHRPNSGLNVDLDSLLASARVYMEKGDLAFSAILFSSHFYNVFLKHSKTDTSGSGVSLRVSKWSVAAGSQPPNIPATPFASALQRQQPL
ncbi:uncharacterized protein LOC121677877 [Alosa sapidissima]|uniref:uncharacterized protein LOC121677877 n=1 Tax=Alosa sapidissima TaxID=34773 RepID=UPI001C091B97|nr:uncharacterized protein LOC121677877 [Alosa sapidissima]